MGDNKYHDHIVHAHMSTQVDPENMTDSDQKTQYDVHPLSIRSQEHNCLSQNQALPGFVIHKN